MYKASLKGLLVAASLVAFTSGCHGPGTLNKGETVVFQNATCYPLDGEDRWAVDIRAEVYSGSWLERFEPKLIEYLEAHHLVVGEEEADILSVRLRPFLDDHPKGKQLRFIVGEKQRRLEPSDTSGRIRCRVTLTGQEVAELQRRPSPGSGWISLRVHMSARDRREFACRARVVPRRGVTVVSDIDDTIKVTDVNNTREMLQNTFLLPFRPVSGMPEIYAAWAKEKDATFRYLSESSVELCTPLSDFITAAGYPEGTLDLREIAWGQSRLKGYMAITHAPPDFKLTELDRIIAEQPDHPYVLVGDSSQHDPEVYGETARKHGAKIRLILIHDVTCQDANAPRYREAFKGLPETLWRIFRDPVEIRNALTDIAA